ncbi:MAG: hypothetical protein V4650_15625 [Pseudomonadota bacterium]
MIVLCYGMLKSGSTLAFELCKAVLEAKGLVQRRLPDEVVRAGHAGNFIGKLLPEQLLGLQAAVGPDEIIAIKTHAPLPLETRAAILAGQAQGAIRLQVSFRDPREICLSLLDAGARARGREGSGAQGFGAIHTLEQAARFIENQIRHCVSWAAVSDALLLPYNEVAFDPDPVITRLCADLGIGMLDQLEREAVRDRVFNRGHTLRNKAVKDRHRELTEPQNQFLLDTIPDARPFVEQVCERQDYTWFARRWRQEVSALEFVQ